MGEASPCTVARCGEKANVDKVAGTRTAQTRVGETVHVGVDVAVARAVIPVGGRLSVGTELHHAEGHRSAGIAVAKETPLDGTGANHRIDISGVVAGRCAHSG